MHWRAKKYNQNINWIPKHGVSFTEAKTVFYDKHAIQFFDPEHSEDEERFIILSTSFTSNTMVVCHCFREEETIIRIVSARKADKDEEQVYWSEQS